MLFSPTKSAGGMDMNPSGLLYVFFVKAEDIEAL